MSTKRKNLVFNLLLLFFAITIDQATKWSVLAFLQKDEIVSVGSFLNLVLVLNLGTSFGLFSPESPLEHHILIALTIICILLLMYLFFNLKAMFEQTFCALLIGGATSNLLDRFFHEGVVDFLDFHYANWHWPAFIVADAFISCSALILLMYNLFCYKKKAI
jgi:signal peptidase II